MPDRYNLGAAHPMYRRFSLILLAWLVSTWEVAHSSPTQAATSTQGGSKVELARAILADENLDRVFQQAKALLGTGFSAGSSYGEVWIRDLNTFIEMSLQVNDPALIRRNLLTFFKFQADDGNIVDGFIPESKAGVGYKYRRSLLAPGLLAHKNTVETDQETSLIQAIARYIRVTGDRSILEEEVGGMRVRKRIEKAMDYLLQERFEPKYGLLWGATTADWGDVQPEHDWGVELDEHSHRAIDIYDNAMFLVAVNDYVTTLADSRANRTKWSRVRKAIHKNARKHLWDAKGQKFRPHLYLAGSPFPPSFDESSVYYHGGTAIAIEAGLLSQAEIKSSLAQMRQNVINAKASSIGLTLYPTYPDGTFKNRSMGPYSYQNGGDWCWFGGRMVQQLAAHGLYAEAYDELRPMVNRVVKHAGFYEWWTPDNQPRGSGQFRGSAGVLGKAILMLRTWAERTVNDQK